VSPPCLNDDLGLLADAARAAGRLILDARGSPGWVRQKGSAGPVTALDIAANDLLREHLRAARPDYGWLSEEDVDDGSRLAARRTFVVDPIDGTAAFLGGRDDWSVALAVIEAGQAVAGCVHAPERGSMMVGGASLGALLDGRAINVRDRNEITGAEAIAGRTVFTDPRWRRQWPPVTTRKVASACLRLAEVARGAADFTLAPGPRAIWDSAPGVALVEGAGGRISEADGAPVVFNRADDPGIASIVAAGPTLHALLVEHMRAALPDTARRTPNGDS
jgi:myo-inositol-1(or 4)-monophosphatase